MLEGVLWMCQLVNVRLILPNFIQVDVGKQSGFVYYGLDVIFVGKITGRNDIECFYDVVMLLVVMLVHAKNLL